MAQESLSLQNHIVWCSIFITQNIQIMHNPDDKPSNCFILLVFSNLFNFHAIHEREPLLRHISLDVVLVIDDNMFAD